MEQWHFLAALVTAGLGLGSSFADLSVGLFDESGLVRSSNDSSAFLVQQSFA